MLEIIMQTVREGSCEEMETIVVQFILSLTPTYGVELPVNSE